MIRSFCGPHSRSQRILCIPFAFQSIGQVRLSRCGCDAEPATCSCSIASVASIFGWSEVTLHAPYLVWAVAAVLGTFTLGQRFCRNLDFQSLRSAPKAFRAEESIPSNRSVRWHRPPEGLCSFRRGVAYSVRSSLFRLRHQRHVRCHAPAF